jgi:hypothetical protein
MFITVSAELAAKQKAKASDADLSTLAAIEKAGLLDPFVLLNRADSGIARDYVPYRETNRDKIRRYLDEFVVPKTPAQTEEAGK